MENNNNTNKTRTIVTIVVVMLLATAGSVVVTAAIADIDNATPLHALLLNHPANGELFHPSHDT